MALKYASPYEPGEMERFLVDQGHGYDRLHWNFETVLTNDFEPGKTGAN